MVRAVDWLVLVYDRFPLSVWVLGSALIYVLGTVLLWLIKPKISWRSPYSRWLLQVGRFVFYVGIPYLALGGWPRQPFQGLLLPDDMGLVGMGERWTVVRWLESAGTGVGLGLATLLILALGWASASWRGNGSRLQFRPRPWWLLLLDVIYLEVHWAFYRGAFAVLIGDVYAGAVTGLGLAYLEWSLNPFWRRGWRLGSQAAEQWLRAALALAMALLFLLTRNLWICLGIHFLLELAFWQMGRRRPEIIPVQDQLAS